MSCTLLSIVKKIEIELLPEEHRNKKLELKK